MKNPVLAAVLTLAAALATVPAHAQNSASASADLGVTVPINAYINLSSSTITIPQPTAADIAAGISRPATITMSYGSNGTIALAYQFTSGARLAGASSDAAVSLGSLRLSVDGGASEVMAEYNNAWRGGIAPGDHTETLAFSLALDYRVKPEQYSGTWQVTLTAN